MTIIQYTTVLCYHGLHSKVAYSIYHISHILHLTNWRQLQDPDGAHCYGDHLFQRNEHFDSAAPHIFPSGKEDLKRSAACSFFDNEQR